MPISKLHTLSGSLDHLGKPGVAFWDYIRLLGIVHCIPRHCCVIVLLPNQDKVLQVLPCSTQEKERIARLAAMAA